MATSQFGRVLIVEDDPEIQAALSELLMHEGYEVDIAGNGADAISFLEGHIRPCAVLVDLLMPGIVGQELLEYIREDDRLASIPVAIVSASPQLAPEGYKVFRKPLDLHPLLEFLREGCIVQSAARGSAM
jgi:two-component system chemotaxis response regulator CheY